MYCGKCGKQIVDESKFCVYCGAKVIRNRRIEKPVYASTPESIAYFKNISEENPSKCNKRIWRRIVVCLCLGILSVMSVFSVNKYLTANEKDLANSVDLANAVGRNWEEFSERIPPEDLEKFQISTQWSDGCFIKDDKGTSLSVREEGSVYSAYIEEFETNYCILGVYIGQSYRKARAVLKKEEMELIGEGKYGDALDSYSDWSDGKLSIFIEEKDNKVMRVGVYLE